MQKTLPTPPLIYLRNEDGENSSQVFGALDKRDATPTQGIISFVTDQDDVGEPVRSARSALRSRERALGGRAGRYLFIAFVKCL